MKVKSNYSIRVPGVIITKPILKSSWGLFFTNGSFGKNGWLLFIITAIPLSPINVSFQSLSSQNVAIVKVLSPVYTQLTWTSESVGTWRFCLRGLQASWQVCICICASVCMSVCPIYGGNLLALWTSPTCAAVETFIQATNNSNFQVGNQQRRNCALYMVYLLVQSVTRSSWLNCALRGHEADNWCDWVSIGHLCLYILNRVHILSGVTDASLTDFER